MRIPLDTHSTFPLYRQIETWIRLNILSGNLQAETRLPSTRDLAVELGVSRITVKNAYAMLESDGVIFTREGSGTYVSAPLTKSSPPANPASVAWPLWQVEAAQQNSSISESTPVRTRSTNVISFTGVGDPRQFPLKEFSQTIREVLDRDGIEALEYGGLDAGYPPLRETITHILTSQGIQARPQEVMITSGSQQALALVCQSLLKPGDVVVVEKPTYNYALELFHSLDLKIIGIEVDAMGMQVEMMEPLLQQQCVRLIYTIPVFQNPSGSCMSMPRRRLLLELAARYNIPILEDDFASDLRFEGRSLPAIKSLDPGGQVIYTGTFSKMLMPGLRVGYLLAAGPIFERLVQQKRVQDLSTSSLMQRVLDTYVTVGRYQTHLRRSIRSYRKRRDALVAAIRMYLPPTVTYSIPHGGLFLWLRLPESLSSTELLPIALREGVEFAPGARFFPEPKDGLPYLRLNFATHTPEEIDEGIEMLGSAVRRLQRDVSGRVGGS